MKDKWKRLVGWRPGPMVYTCAAVLALMALLLPLIRLTEYAVPWYDDYVYGRFAKDAMLESRTLLNALKGTWECIRISWHAWQGTYSSIFFMTLMPGIWGEEYYHFGPVFLILFITVCVGAMVYTLLRTVLKTDWQHALGIAAVSAALAVVMIHTAQEGFYWYNGGIHYVGMHGFCMLMLSCAVQVLCAGGWKRKYVFAVLTMMLAFLTAGGNLVTSLQGLLVLLSIVALGLWKKRGQVYCLLPAAAAYIGGFYLNVAAPGNDKRAKSFEGWGLSPLEAIFTSFKEAAECSREFTGWMTLLFLALMLPLVWHMVKRVDYGFKLPGLVTAWSVCLYATGFTPSLFSLGHAGLDRTLNAVKLTWQMLLVLNLIYWCGWFVKRREQIKGQMCRWWYYGLVAAAALVVFDAEPNQAGSFSSYGAYYYISTGEAYNFYQEYLNRVELLKSDREPVVLEPYVWRPWFLCMGDLSDNPEDESNMAFAAWYDKETVICQSQINQ